MGGGGLSEQHCNTLVAQHCSTARTKSLQLLLAGFCKEATWVAHASSAAYLLRGPRFLWVPTFPLSLSFDYTPPPTCVAHVSPQNVSEMSRKSDSDG